MMLFDITREIKDRNSRHGSWLQLILARARNGALHGCTDLRPQNHVGYIVKVKARRPT
jgi:hypothetical protein